MQSPDGRYTLVYNGELYNFRELREELGRERWPFRTEGDTEVVLASLAVLGRQAIARFNGMFALAFWDAERRELLLARDRFGQKPLYIAKIGDGLVFASEVRAILDSGLTGRRLDAASLLGFLCYGSVPGPGTLVEGVGQVEPGTTATWTAGAGLRTERYWEPGRSTLDRSPEQLREILAEAVERHLLSDVPLGIFLSGGLDSAAVAALARLRRPRGIRTFTLIFPDEPAQGEAAEARESARHIGTDHVEVPVSADSALEGLDAAVRSQDQPSGDGFNTWLVARAARAAGLTVALSGLGADELFGGYGTFRDVPRLARLRTATGPLSGLAARAASIASAASPRRAGRLADLFRAPAGLLEALLVRRRVFSCDQIRSLAPRLATEPWIPGIAPDRVARLSGLIAARPAEDAVALLELDLYMGDTLLRDADTMGMAHSLEIRVPFLDNDIVDASLSLPSAARRPVPRPKHALADAVCSLLPPALPGRPKRGFTLPLAAWMRGTLGKSIGRGLQALPELCSSFDAASISRLWDAFLQRPESIGWFRPWMLFLLGGWLARTGVCRS